MKLKIMSLNVRINTTNDGINSFTNRRERVKECIMAEKPDIIGIQEANDEMTEWMRTDLRSRYYIVGTGREKDLRGEGARIAYNKKKFELVSLDTRWLSETPDTAEQDTLYRVRLTADDAASQLGAFRNLDSAKDLARQNKADGYKVYDQDGKLVYKP